MQLKAILNKIVASFKSLVESDGEIFEANVGERALTSNLARHMRANFPGWTVDAEWDRRKTEIKRLRYGRIDRRIIPDIIVHRRFKKRNLIAIEVKKQGNREGPRDHWKLRGMTR